MKQISLVLWLDVKQNQMSWPILHSKKLQLEVSNFLLFKTMVKLILKGPANMSTLTIFGMAHIQIHEFLPQLVLFYCCHQAGKRVTKYVHNLLYK